MSACVWCHHTCMASLFLPRVLPLWEEATWAKYWMTFFVFSVFPAPDSPLGYTVRDPKMQITISILDSIYMKGFNRKHAGRKCLNMHLWCRCMCRAGRRQVWRRQTLSALLLLEKNKRDLSKNRCWRGSKRIGCLVPNDPDGLKMANPWQWQEESGRKTRWQARWTERGSKQDKTSHSWGISWSLYPNSVYEVFKKTHKGHQSEHWCILSPVTHQAHWCSVWAPTPWWSRYSSIQMSVCTSAMGVYCSDSKVLRTNTNVYC